MTFDGFDLTSFDRIKHSFPSLDQHVSVENGICYLSLLEQFTQLRTTFADCLDAFHARAELRYELWIRGCQNRSSLGISFSAIIPPIDVAYISHAHLVSPFRYYEDCQRMMPHMLCFSMPLLQLHLQRGRQPNEESMTFWADQCAKGGGGREPFTLTIDDLVSELPGYRECPLCKKCFKLTGLDYGKWRTDSTVYLKCWFCEQEFNVHDVAIEQIVNDLMRERQANEKDVAWIRGTMLNNRGTLKKSVTESGSESITHRLKRIFLHQSHPRPQEQPTHGGAGTSVSMATTSHSSSRAMSGFIENSIRRKTTSMYDVEPILLRQLHFRALEQEYTAAEEKQKQRKVKDLAYAINACYGNNPSSFSLDLIQAAKRQHDFHERLVHFSWSIPDSFVLGIRHYKNFLLAMRYDDTRAFMGISSSALAMAEVGLVWQLHMLFPTAYRRFTLKHTNSVVNHEDLIPYYSLEDDDDDDDNEKKNEGHYTAATATAAADAEEEEGGNRRFSTTWIIIKGKQKRSHSARVHPSLGSDYHHGSIVVDDPIDSLSICSDRCS